LLALNTEKSKDGVNFSYYWTSLGLDVQHHMGIIKLQETVDNRKADLPEFIE